MDPIEARWLASCAAIATGIAGAILFPRGAELWPLSLGLGVLVSLLGFGLSQRGWWFLALLFLAMALAFHARVEQERLYRDSPWMRGVSHDVRRGSVSYRLTRLLSERVAIGVAHAPNAVTLNRAILLGERARLSPDVKKIFVDSGAIHIFAISGLHVMVIARVFMVIAAVLFVPVRWQGFVALPFLWGYVFLIGLPPSAVRATLMASFYFLAPIFHRRSNGIVAWALSFFVVHLLAPEQLSGIGSLLSFTVMLALVVVGRLIHMPRRFFGQVLTMTTVAWSAGVPIVAMSFGRLTPGGLFANLILIPISTYTVVSSLLGLLLGFVWETLASHFNNLAAVATDAMVLIASAIARLPYASIEIPSWSAVMCGGWYLSLALIVYLIRRVQTRRRQI